jgi:predicted anti-sigma-YlaC factor YlaD
VTCREVISFLMDYLSGDLPLRQRLAFQVHLLMCSSCRAYLKTYEQTVKMEKGAFDTTNDPALENVPEELVQAILAVRKKDSEQS